ncbi:MAG: hypothetical protein D6696_08955, partial [Acidobacteria bacterium]
MRPPDPIYPTAKEPHHPVGLCDEQTGVEPDVAAGHLPHATFEGDDAQLHAAVDYLLEKIRDAPTTVP